MRVKDLAGYEMTQIDYEIGQILFDAELFDLIKDCGSGDLQRKFCGMIPGIGEEKIYMPNENAPHTLFYKYDDDGYIIDLWYPITNSLIIGDECTVEKLN